ncbi:chemotaxis protein CheB [Luteimonas sp. MC1895]|uniref:chemotaxis protein CheB n=1 Tax=Luteimonas sp. MC1895 TaxID=2819513 RepID=UPI0018F0829B|nr:chemotaxis protein CheB [Luteimonas sp. MC1895]MBJ6980142.1 chemotaxis protein [Luteimonas sp. MC1895]
MAEPVHQAVRVLLLAREGEARLRLEAALADAGAELLGAVDPATGDPDEARALRPAVVLVALEPAIEDALERYDALLSDPAVLVMFDEADVAARRDGWDAARWVRHLAAKLHGHEDVLPPGGESEDTVHPVPGGLPERAFDPQSIDIGAMADAAQDLAAEVPRADDFDASPADAPAGFSGLVAAEDMDWSSAGGDELSLADDPALAELIASAAASREGIEGDADRAEDSLAGLDGGSTFDTAGLSFAEEPAVPAGNEPPVDAPASAPARDPLSLGDGLSLADDDAPLATREPAGTIDLDALESRLEGLSLADDESGPIATRDAGANAIDLDALGSRLDGISLADPDSYGHGQLRGAVVVEAGLGGPDAVRQLLGGLGEDFARTVLVRLQLDGGRYERLVQQMQRASALPVALAETGHLAEAGTVYFLAPGVTIVDDRARLRFADAGGDQATGYDALPATDSALVFLSGASVERVERAAAMADAGALVLAQAPGSCYDGAAVTALVAQGAVSAEPGDLAQALIDRWP